MTNGTTKEALEQGQVFERDPLEKVIHQEIRRVIERVLGEELEAALQASSYERTEERAG